MSRLRVLYVDALQAPNAKANVYGMVSAYERVAKVNTFDYRTCAAQHGKQIMNDALAEAAQRFKPDFIHLGKCESVTGAGLEAIRKLVPGVVIIHFFGDYRDRVVPWVADIGRAADRTVMQINGGPLIRRYEAAGCKNIGYWPAGTDPDIYGPRKVRQKDMPIVFMGTLGNPKTFEWYGGRRELVEAIANSGNDVHVFGGGWDKVKHAKVYHHKYVGSDGFSQACSQSQIALGYSAKDIPGYTSWPRILNSMICETMYLTRYFTGLEKIFKGGLHLDWFESIPEAVEKVEFWMARPGWRDSIARKGRQEVLRAHLWDHRIAKMLEYAGF